VCLAAVFAVASYPRHPAAASIVDQEAVMAIRHFLALPTSAHQYRASRRLEASGSGHRAWLDVQTNFSTASGLRYEVTAEGGSGYIRARVLRSLLDEEQRLIARKGESAVALTTANYQFTPEGIDDDGLAIVEMRPLRKEPLPPSFARSRPRSRRSSKPGR
jgi:hypothetical protein